MNPPAPAFDRFVALARHQLEMLRWDEIEPSLAVGWGELNEPELPDWDSVAECVRRAAQDEGASRDSQSPLS